MAHAAAGQFERFTLPGAGRIFKLSRGPGLWGPPQIGIEAVCGWDFLLALGLFIAYIAPRRLIPGAPRASGCSYRSV